MTSSESSATRLRGTRRAVEGGPAGPLAAYGAGIQVQDLAAYLRGDERCDFDPGYDWLPLEHFEPAVREVFTREPSFY